MACTSLLRHWHWFGLKRVALVLVPCLSLLGCTQGSETPAPEEILYGEWLKVEPAGAICSNGSQYKLFVNYSQTSDNLMVMLEGGGACWDYPSCTGKAGIRGAANIDGITDNHMAIIQFAFPFLRRDDPTNPLYDWNLVYVPYCTGDIHTGNNVITYTDPDGLEPDVEFHHAGYPNMLKITEWLSQRFTHIPELVMSGCSAGGVGSLASYYFYRNALSPEKSYLLNDSGPIFPGSVNSKPLYDQIRASWAVDTLFTGLPAQFNPDDLGTVSTALADIFPNDRLSITYFLRDYNYSVYSYERFYANLTKDDIHQLWAEDTDLLTAAYDTRDNLAYFIPYWRQRNDSHCGTLIDYVGTEIQEQGVDLGDFVDLLLDDSRPLQSYRESVQPNEDVTPPP